MLMKRKYLFPIVLDETTDIASDYLVSGLPTSYFIDENGMIYGKFSGMMTYDMMQEFISDIEKIIRYSKY
jgi:AhpC/TSA family.